MIKFSLASFFPSDANRKFSVMPDGTVVSEFMVDAVFDAAVVDVSSDPPFTLGGMTGPTTATSKLQNPVVGVPEPSTLALLALGIIGLVGRRRAR